MIVWLASYPRSGNTYLRIVLNRLYGVASSTVYDVDGVAERLGSALVGYEPRPAEYAEMRAAATVHFVKTHRQRDRHVAEADRAICLVRDGRDCLVSWAHLLSEAEPAEFEPRLRELIERDSPTGTGSWGANVLSWLEPPAPQRVLLRYEALVVDPVGSVTACMAALVPELQPRVDAEVPDFAALRQADARFFRRGISGSHRDELPAGLQELFWSRPDNVRAMRLFGFS